ncbi:OLC1v1001921C2 [Oldenlandia corymbosa var. corymbosa]|uniref:Bidirectional sugar transporter SWEET n=1 Tax=Oldenlandia corymbosa var. corymbosa TaxID=529605 RepID=A0AAV1D7L7_OLDCO|nr:OLC1v1001921C2 [Oldenlandia corymbosa var. corymbosa]
MAASLSVILGIIGNVISILMFLAPVKTFKRIIKKKSTEDYKGIPYITTLLSTSLWSFYGLLKPGGLLVVTVNGTGCILHIVYVVLFIVYAPKDVKVQSMKLVGLVDIGFLGVVVAVTLLALHGGTRLTLVGLLCAALTVGMYASPLSAMRTVIKTKSVEYMPFFLSFFQFLNGGIWAAYAVIVKDIYLGVPNGIGFALGSAQILLYVIYKNKSPFKSKESMEEEGSAHLVKDRIHDEKELKNRGLSKGRSLPKPGVDRQYSQEIVRTSSLTPGGNNRVGDLELGVKENAV